MSRIGKMPITVPAGVTVTVENNLVTVKGPKGELQRQISQSMKITMDNGVLTVERPDDEKENRAKHGLYRALIANMVKGVTEGYTKSLTVHGVGYKIAVSGNKLTLNIGLSHAVNVTIPEGLTVTCPTATEILVAGINKELVGQFAADIKAIKPVEPYHGYGIHYTNETVIRKEIKKGGKKK